MTTCVYKGVYCQFNDKLYYECVLKGSVNEKTIDITFYDIEHDLCYNGILSSSDIIGTNMPVEAVYKMLCNSIKKEIGYEINFWISNLYISITFQNEIIVIKQNIQFNQCENELFKIKYEMFALKIDNNLLKEQVEQLKCDNNLLKERVGLLESNKKDLNQNNFESNYIPKLINNEKPNECDNKSEENVPKSNKEKTTNTEYSPIGLKPIPIFQVPGFGSPFGFPVIINNNNNLNNNVCGNNIF